ncbi:MAG: copper homeostasis membrane protein CopD [Sphingomicrobium sp.]
MLDWPLIAVRFGLYVTLAALFGLSAFGLYGLRKSERRHALALRQWLAGSAIVSLLLSGSWLVLMASSMADVAPWPVDRTALDAILASGAIATSWKVRMIALLVAGLASFRLQWLWVVMLCGSVALATLAWTGHGAVDEGVPGWIHLGADILHLIASGAWVGALLGLVLLATRRVGQIDREHLGLTHRALHGFGGVGTIVVATLILTGLVNGWLLVGYKNVLTLMTTPYGQLLVVKLLLFAGMLGLAALNRFRLTPDLEKALASDHHPSAVGVLRRSLLTETSFVIAILALVAWLGTLAPPLSAA